MKLERLGKLIKSKYLIGSWTCDHPACSRMPQPLCHNMLPPLERGIWNFLWGILKHIDSELIYCYFKNCKHGSDMNYCGGVGCGCLSSVSRYGLYWPLFISLPKQRCWIFFDRWGQPRWHRISTGSVTCTVITLRVFLACLYIMNPFCIIFMAFFWTL
jgi:hypothetical protein